MNRVCSIAFYLLHALLLSGVSFAQQEKTVSVQFVSFPKAANPAPVELYLGEDETMKVDLPTRSLSKAYKVKQQTIWSLGKTAKDENGENYFQVYGKAASINSSKQLILVLRKGPKDSDGFKLIVMENHDGAFGGGEYLIMNASRVDIGGYLGDKKYSLKPGKHVLLAPKSSPGTKNSRVCFVKMFYENQATDKSTAFFSSEWRYSKGARVLAFAYHEPVGGRLRLHVIRDYL